MSLLKDYVALSQFNYIYPFGSLPSNLFFRKPNPNPYWLSNDLKNMKVASSKKPTTVDIDMTVDQSAGDTISLTGNTKLFSSSTKSLVGPYIDVICSSGAKMQYSYSVIAGNAITDDEQLDGHVKVAFDLKNTPLPAAFIKNHVKLIKKGHMDTSICRPCDDDYHPGFTGELVFIGKDAAGADTTTIVNMTEAKHASCPGAHSLTYEIKGARLIFKWTKTHRVSQVEAEFIASIVEETKSNLLSVEDPFNIDAIVL